MSAAPKDEAHYDLMTSNLTEHKTLDHWMKKLQMYCTNIGMYGACCDVHWVYSIRAGLQICSSESVVNTTHLHVFQSHQVVHEVPSPLYDPVRSVRRDKDTAEDG